MRGIDWLGLIGTGSRHAVFLIIAVVGFLHLAPPAAPGPVAVLYAIGWATAAAVKLRATRGDTYGGKPALVRARAAATATVVTGSTAVVILAAPVILGTVLLPAPGSFLEEIVARAPHALVPMVFLVPLVFAWEWGSIVCEPLRALFAPLTAFLLVGLFWTQAEFRTDLLGHPWQYALLGVILVILFVLQQTVNGSGTPAVDAVRGGVLRAGRIVIILVVVLAVLGAYRVWREGAVTAGGGLVRPTLFQFDFADVISLESEIQLGRDLVMVYREEQPPEDRLLRRYVLSGYSRRRGFYRLEPEEEPSPVPPLTVRDAIDTDLPAGDRHSGRVVSQEYYLVNFDPQAFLAVAEPTRVVSLPRGAGSSFNNAYRVVSRRPDEERLREIERPDELTPEWRAAYVDTEVPHRVAALARDITDGMDSYYDRVRALEEYLLEEYYYSLSPGDALDGDQLQHFLFESRKGYCSYFAFSMVLMGRALGIPARVAAGFFVVPGTDMMGFHPIRGDMAHAWVEVFFPGVGWVEFDPTSSIPAPGETFATDYSIDRDQLAALVEEILAAPKDVTDESERPSVPEDGSGSFSVLVSRLWHLRYVLLVLIIIAWVSAMRIRWWRRGITNPRYRGTTVFLQVRRALAASGVSGLREAPLGRTPPPLSEAGELAVRARFGRTFTRDDLRRLEDECRRVVRTRARDLLRAGPLYRGLSGSLMLLVRVGLIPWTREARRGGTRAGVLVFVLLIAPLSPAREGLPAAQQPAPSESVEYENSLAPADPAALEEEIRRALDADNYREALRRIERARTRFPEDGRFPLLEGDLYYSQELYKPAESAYRNALARGAPETDTRYALARTLARLNRDDQAISQLEILHADRPEDTLVVGDLGWLYFKRHRLHEARRLLEDTLERTGPIRDLTMTLATVHAGLYDYHSARDAYQSAVEQARRTGDRFFEAVALYNKSILEANFHNWDAAYAAAQGSLAAAERSSGYMIRGELNHRRMDMQQTWSDYERADVLDRDTPLPGLSIAALLLDKGHPRRALNRIERIREQEQANWMYSYGTDPARYELRVYRLLAESWTAAARRDRLFRPGTLVHRLRLRVRSLLRHAVGWYYRGLARRQAAIVARDLEREGRALPAARQRMVATEHFPRLALRHAARARSLETEFNPEAELDYRLLEATLRRDTEELTALLELLDSPWRRIDRVEALRELYRAEGAGSDVGLAAAGEAYLYAPGSFLVEGLRIPVALDAGDVPERDRHRITRDVRRMGFLVTSRSPLQLIFETEYDQAGRVRLEYRLVYGHAGNDEAAPAVPVRSGTVRGAETRTEALREAAEALTREPLPGVESTSE